MTTHNNNQSSSAPNYSDLVEIVHWAEVPQEHDPDCLAVIPWTRSQCEIDYPCVASVLTLDSGEKIKETQKCSVDFVLTQNEDFRLFGGRVDLDNDGEAHPIFVFKEPFKVLADELRRDQLFAKLKQDSIISASTALRNMEMWKLMGPSWEPEILVDCLRISKSQKKQMLSEINRQIARLGLTKNQFSPWSERLEDLENFINSLKGAFMAGK